MDYEILSPAGSVESLITAVMCNADAVYLGLEKFNARQNAQNFNRDNFAEWVNYCHLFGTKVYVTINTSIKQNEFKDALDLLNFVYANFADGVILTDLALIKYAGRKLKGLDIIASTQLNVNNVLGAKYLESLGVSTVVVARECKFEDIEQIKAQTKLKIEVFIHGALCVCQSGQCLFSSIVGGNSGNRGLCAQPCRKLYTATDKLGRKLNNGYLLSCSDLCGLNIAKKLFNAGATSFKIEGRNRRREYVGQTTLTYKRLFSHNFKFTSNDESDLKSIFNRGDYTEGYYSGRNDKIICPDIPSHKGLYCGKLFNNNTISECQFPIVKGDAFKVLRFNKEVGNAVALASGNNFVPLSLSGAVAKGDEIYITSRVTQLESILTETKKIPICMTFTARVGERAQLIGEYNGIKVIVYSEELVDKSLTSPINKSEIIQQLQKTGNSEYTITDIVVDIDDVYMLKSTINQLRRDCLTQLSKKIVLEYNRLLGDRTLDYCEVTSNNDAVKVTPSLTVVAENIEQIAKLKESKINTIIYKPLNYDLDNIGKVSEMLCDADWYLALPSYADLYDIDEVQTIITHCAVKGIYADNIYSVQLAQNFNLKLYGGLGLNIYNSFMADVLSATQYIYSAELMLSEISQCRSSRGNTFVDGKLTLMKLTHCPNKLNNLSNCNNCKYETIYYTDELNNKFPIERIKLVNCTFELYNCVKLSATKKILKADKYVVYYDENVLKHYININNGIVDNYCVTVPHTTGKLFTKVN